MKIDRGSNKDEMAYIQRLTVREVLYIQQWGEGAWLTRRVARHITHLMGTLRKNRKGLPVDVKESKLKRGQLIGRKNADGIMVVKWRDVRDVLLLSTCHEP